MIKQILILINNGQTRSVEARKNILALLLIKGIIVVINLLQVPLTIKYVTTHQYGIWLTLSSIVSWISFFDIGFGNGMRNKLAEAKAHNKTFLAQEYISTTYAILSIIFFIVWIFLILTNHYINWCKILHAPLSMATELSNLAFIVITYFCLQMVLQIIYTVLIADQRPAFSSFFNMLGQLISLLTIYILTKTTRGSLINLGLSMGFIPIIVLLVTSIIMYNGPYIQYRPTIKTINLALIKNIMTLGIKFFIIQFSAVIIFQTTNLIITQVLGAEQVTIYNIAYKYFFSANMLFSIILTPFWSAFTEAYTKKEFEWMMNVMRKLKKTWIYFVLIVVIMFIISSVVYKYWIGELITIPLSISIAMAIYVLLFTRLSLFIVLINGIGKVQLQLYINIVISILYIPLSLFCGKYFGLLGILIVNIFVSLIHSILGQIQLSKILARDAKNIWNK